MQPEVTPQLSPPVSGIVVDARHVIPRDEVEIRVSRAGGAGGQHVNKTSSRVELHWSPGTSSALDTVERERVVSRLARRLGSDGFVRIVASETRSQLRNRAAAEGRLAELVRQALRVPKARKKTRPGKAAREARLATKKHLSGKKASRRWSEEN